MKALSFRGKNHLTLLKLICYTLNTIEIQKVRKGKPTARWGHKATGLKKNNFIYQRLIKIAGLPNIDGKLSI